MRPIHLAALALMSSSSALAAPCTLEHWRFEKQYTMTIIEGSTSCPRGWITIRAYDGSDQYLGNTLGHIDGYAFRAVLSAPSPKKLKIKYVIETR